MEIEQIEASIESRYQNINKSLSGMLLMYKIENANNIYETYNLNRISSATSCKTDTRFVVDLGKILNELKKNYGMPSKNKSVLCENYLQYCGQVNIIAHIYNNILEYEKERNATTNPKKYIQFKFSSIPIMIRCEDFDKNIRKCSDYDKFGSAAQYPSL